MEKCFEIHCNECGAIFMNEEAIIPKSLECICKSKEFSIAEALSA